MLRPRRPPALRRPPAAAALHRPPQAALMALLERWRARHPPAPGPPGDAALRALLSSPAFCRRRTADWLPARADGLSPATAALVAQYLARHRLREPRLLDSLAAFLLARLQQLHPKVIQKLVFPFSRTNYRPSNHTELFPQLESVLVRKAAASPLATVNILMSLFQLQYFPLAVLHEVFSPGFPGQVTSSPCGPIMRRYLSLLDVAVALEAQQYDGPRLDPQYRVCMFDGVLTADEANRKYSYKGLVAEALRQLVGEDGYQQDEVLPPGYYADFLLWISHSGSVLPLRQASQPSQAVGPPEIPDFQTLCLPREGQLLPAALGLPSSAGAVPDGTQKAKGIHRVVLSVNDEWHYCQNSAVLVGSRAMHNRHLCLLGYHLVQVPYMELEKVSGVEGAKQYLCQRLRRLQVNT